MASQSILAMLLTTKYVDSLPLHRFKKVLGRHGIDIPRQTLVRWVIQCREHFQPLFNLMRDSLLASRVIHCDETRVQVVKEPNREPSRREPPVRDRKKELIVQRYAYRRESQCSTLQLGRDCQSQRPRALCVAALPTLASANGGFD